MDCQPEPTATPEFNKHHDHHIEYLLAWVIHSYYSALLATGYWANNGHVGLWTGLNGPHVLFFVLEWGQEKCVVEQRADLRLRARAGCC
jgi:hypothetical protein